MHLAPRPGTGKSYQLYERHPDEMMELIGSPALIEPLRSLLGQNIVFRPQSP